MKYYECMPDLRELDLWGKPIGKKYEDKDWDALTVEEMKADFDWKSDVLDAFGEEVNCATFYQEYLFRELMDGSELGEDYKVALTEYDAEAGAKYHKVDVEDIDDYLNLDDVALSPCLFHMNWRKKKLLNYVSAFVLDIDKCRPKNLQRFFMLFDENRVLRPTFIANSGSGVHFYYLLDEMFPIDSVNHSANNKIAEEIYKSLYDEIAKKEWWKDAQRHWIGQDYRVVNSRTKFNQVSRIFKVGDLYTIQDLIDHFDIKIKATKRFATPQMVKYAKGIAINLKLDPPDFENFSETYKFIAEHKEADYIFRQERKAKYEEQEIKKGKKCSKSKSKPQKWYKRTYEHMKDNTAAGYRFSSMKALAIIAYIEEVDRDIFLADIRQLADYWSKLDWKGDDFNLKNVEAIERFFDNAEKYQASSHTLEEWLGYEFRRVPVKRNGRSQKEHMAVMRAIQQVVNPNWRENSPHSGRNSKKEVVHQWQRQHPEGRKIDCERDTGLSRHTVLKWWE